jgi:uncharacterized protein (TIGR04255 family)
MHSGNGIKIITLHAVTSMMSLPKKITPDNIKDAIVEVKYDSDTPFEVLIGIFAEAFDSSWFYTNRPVSGNPGVSQWFPNLGREMIIRVGTENFLYNAKISLRLLPGSFIIFFTVNPNYLGWHIYFNELTAALNIIQKTGKIKQWTRVGVRYISHYQQLDLRTCTRFDFSFGLPGIKSDYVSFRSDFSYNNAKVILNLSSLVPVATGPEAVVPTSIVDIDVIRENLHVIGVEELLKLIDDTHSKEKELYFKMIKDEYLSTLKPEY